MPQNSFKAGQPATTAIATIRIRDLRLRTFIGFNPEEKAKKQDVVINLEIAYRANRTVFEDRVEDALNYKTITKEIIDLVENGRFLLLEKLVADVLAVCCRHPETINARVTIDKPHALRFAESVSLSLEYRADENTYPFPLEKVS
jgi:D-erythro-7,8-dihydroneopterin triphosphate epimerase